MKDSFYTSLPTATQKKTVLIDKKVFFLLYIK